MTKEQFLRCFPQSDFEKRQWYPDLTCPIVDMTWYEAAAYCNWLSAQEGIPKDQWCYETNPQGQVVRLKENYLRLTGYRLPTEAEWEYACRAGAETSRHYGETDELLGEYGWYVLNTKPRTWPAGGKKPNDLGLFDLHGNIFTWCQESCKDYPRAQGGEAVEDKEDILDIKDKDGRVLRGGAFFSPASSLRSAFHNQLVPAESSHDIGIRPARTFP